MIFEEGKSTIFLNFAVGINVTVFSSHESVGISVLNAERSITRLVAESIGSVVIDLIPLIDDSNIRF